MSIFQYPLTVTIYTRAQAETTREHALATTCKIPIICKELKVLKRI